MIGPAPGYRILPCKITREEEQKGDGGKGGARRAARAWTVEWTPVELGVQTVDVRYGGRHVLGSPFKCKVFDLSRVRILRDEGQSSGGVDLDGIPGDDIVFRGLSCS